MFNNFHHATDHYVVGKPEQVERDWKIRVTPVPEACKDSLVQVLEKPG